MPLSRPALTLARGPRGVQDARRWVVQTCLDIDRPDLVECAELGVSELVTNAVLHGADPIQVRVRGTREHPRVEVRDASVERPVLPGPLGLDPDDDLLLTFGRGLSIVARSADAWGAEIESDGKVVWFAPAT
ncbi:MAG TPA: ATP-binding protein, partial [Marmoricola sp.]|nr:ATP-binding protein [Marmoricola sp.]